MILSPAVISGNGICAYAVGKNYSVDSESAAKFFLSYFGKSIKVSAEEELENINDLILASSIFSFKGVNLLIEGGVKNGISEEISAEIVANVMSEEIKILTERDSVKDYLMEQISGEKEIFEYGRKILEKYDMLAPLNKSFEKEDTKNLMKFHYHYW